MADPAEPRDPSGSAAAPAVSRLRSVPPGWLAAAVALALVAGFALGKLVNPASPTAGAGTGAPGTGTLHDHGPGASAGSDVGGLSVSSGGYTLAPQTKLFTEPGEHELNFVVTDGNGDPVTTFAIVHDKPLHMVVLRRDLSGYQHLHPTMAKDGTWTIRVNLDRPGMWRVYADFTAVAEGGTHTAVTLGYDLTVTGDYQPEALPVSAQESTVDDFTVKYAGQARVGATAPLLFTVWQGDTQIEALEPYLGSFGHLVAVRAADMGYAHVHPEPQLVAGAVKFWLAAPSAGVYKMFFDFQVGGQVRTAEFTLAVA